MLYHTALSGSTEIADLLVAHGGTTDTAGHALLAAVGRGHLEMTKWLLQKQPDVNTTNFQGKTPLDLAKAGGHEEIAALLEAAGGKAGES